MAEQDSKSVGQSLEKSDTIKLRKRHLGSSCKLFFKKDPVKIVQARGQYMYDEMGNRYLDCINNVCHVGHSHPHVVKAAADQMAVLNTNNRYLHDNIVLLAQKLASLFPDPLSVCFFTNSGSEANDLAVRLAKAHTNHTDAIVLDHAYHGHTTTVLDLSPYKLRPEPDWVTTVPNPDCYRGIYTPENCPEEELGDKYAQKVKDACDKIKSEGRSVAAFFAESLQSCGGQVIPPKNYLRNVYKHIRAAGGICVADEVQVGFGRVGKHWWAFQLQGEDVVPDIVTIGKPMGNGHPVAAVITTPAVAASFAATGMEYFNTYGGNPVSCAVALAVIEVIEKEKLREKAVEIGDYLISKLETLKDKYQIIGDIRGFGMFVGIDLVKDRKTKVPATAEAQHIISRLKEEFILYSADGPHRNVLKFKPPMCFTKENVDELVSCLDSVLAEVAEDSSEDIIKKAAKQMAGGANAPVLGVHLPASGKNVNGNNNVTRSDEANGPPAKQKKIAGV